MITGTRDQSGSSSLWSDYRQIRRGVIGGVRLEEALRKDLEWLLEIQQRGTLGELEFMFARQSIGAVAEGVEQTIRSLDGLIEAAEAKGIMDNTAKVIQLVRERAKDAQVRRKIINALMLNGGVRHYLEVIRLRFAIKQHAYSAAIRNLDEGGAAALSGVVADITINLDSLTEEQLKEYWRKRLEEESEKGRDDNLIMFSDVAWELCMKYPKIAYELGVDCPKCGFGLGVLIVVGVILILLGVTLSCES